jgi:hypothetical protein
MMLGPCIGARVLALVEPSAVFKCARCKCLLADVIIGGLNYAAEIERPFADKYLLNLVAEHFCPPREVEQ